MEINSFISKITADPTGMAQAPKQTFFGGLWDDMKQMGKTGVKYIEGKLLNDVSGTLSGWSGNLKRESEEAFREADKTGSDMRKALGLETPGASMFMIFGGIILVVLLMKGGK